MIGLNWACWVLARLTTVGINLFSGVKMAAEASGSPLLAYDTPALSQSLQEGNPFSSHCAFIEMPDEFNSVSLDFIAEHALV